MGITYQFPPDSLEHSISGFLAGKAVNASLVASELGKMLKSTFNQPEASVEERAAIRETAVQNAAQIAKDYFNDPDEAAAFMELIRKAADKDILREMGYYVYDNSDEIRMPHSPEPMSAKDAADFTAFQNALNKNTFVLDTELIAQLSDDKKKVADMISAAIDNMSETSVNDSLQRLLKAFTFTMPEGLFAFGNTGAGVKNDISYLFETKA